MDTIVIMIRIGDVMNTKLSVLYVHSIIHGIFCRPGTCCAITGMISRKIPAIISIIPVSVNEVFSKCEVNLCYDYVFALGLKILVFLFAFSKLDTL